ncbi:TolC family protein, partial [Methylomonas rosea]
MPTKPHRPMLWILSALSAVWTVGCESPAPRDAKALAFQVQPRWSSNGHFAEPAASGWLETFNDPHLMALVRAGLTDNFDLKSAAASVDAAREQAVIAGSGRWPQLSLISGYQRAKTNIGGENSESGAFTAMFNLSWELDVWGRIKAGQQAAETEAEAAGDDYRAAQLSLAARIAQAYFEFSEAQLQAAVAAQSVKDRGVIVDLVRGRFNKGLTRGLDLRLVLTDLANAEAQLAQARNDVQLIGKRLQTLLGRYPGDNPAKQDGSNEFDPTLSLPQPPPTLSAGLPAELLDRRPDVIAAFRRLRAADSRLESAEKALLPRVTL